MTNEFLNSKAYEQLRMHAIMENSPILYAMLQSYNHQPDRWGSVEEFLADTALALASALSGAQAQLVDALSTSRPANVCARCANWR